LATSALFDVPRGRYRRRNIFTLAIRPGRRHSDLDTLGTLDDCQRLFENLHALCGRDTRLIVAYFPIFWYPALKLAELLGLRMKQPPQNVLAPADVQALAAVVDFELVKSEMRLLLPARMLGLGRRTDYVRLRSGRSYFGDFDPIGDFDLIFGASKLSLKVVEVPIRPIEPMARPNSRVFAMVLCCFAWASLHSCASRSCETWMR
jgi:hypothetical protein